MRFVRQDQKFRKRLKKAWRKPKGSQSKLRKRKGGSGLVARVGYGKPVRKRDTTLSSMSQLESAAKAKEGGASLRYFIASEVGSLKRKTMLVRANELGVPIANARRSREKVRKREIMIAKKKDAGRKSKKEEKKEGGASEGAGKDEEKKGVKEAPGKESRARDSAKKEEPGKSSGRGGAVNG